MYLYHPWELLAPRNIASENIINMNLNKMNYTLRVRHFILTGWRRKGRAREKYHLWTVLSLITFDVTSQLRPSEVLLLQWQRARMHLQDFSALLETTNHCLCYSLDLTKTFLSSYTPLLSSLRTGLGSAPFTSWVVSLEDCSLRGVLCFPKVTEVTVMLLPNICCALWCIHYQHCPLSHGNTVLL